MVITCRVFQTLHGRMEAAASCECLFSWPSNISTWISHTNNMILVKGTPAWFRFFYRVMRQWRDLCIQVLNLILNTKLLSASNMASVQWSHSAAWEAGSSCIAFCNRWDDAGNVQGLILLFFLNSRIFQSQVFALAESLGAVESLVECPSPMTNSSAPDDWHALLGINDTLIWLSIGIESCQDLIDDLETALNSTI